MKTRTLPDEMDFRIAPAWTRAGWREAKTRLQHSPLREPLSFAARACAVGRRLFDNCRIPLDAVDRHGITVHASRLGHSLLREAQP